MCVGCALVRVYMRTCVCGCFVETENTVVMMSLARSGRGKRDCWMRVASFQVWFVLAAVICVVVFQYSVCHLSGVVGGEYRVCASCLFSVAACVRAKR